MDYQFQDFGQDRQFEGVSNGVDEIYIPREIPEDRRPSLFGNGRVKEEQDIDKNSKEVNPRVMYAVLLRVFRDISTGQLYIEANTLFEISPKGQYDDSYRYSGGLIPITRELLLQLARAYEARREVHVDILEIPIDLSKSYTYSSLDEFEKESKDKGTTKDDKKIAIDNMLKEKINKDDIEYDKKLNFQ